MWLARRCRPCTVPGADPKKDTVRVQLLQKEDSPAGDRRKEDSSRDRRKEARRHTEGQPDALLPSAAARLQPHGGVPVAPVAAAGEKAAPQGAVFEQIKSATRGLLGHLTEIALEYPYKELAAATRDFGKDHRLGEGAAGAVYRGTLRGGTQVAVKVLNDLGGLEGFEDEVRVLSRFRHPHLVTLLGWGQHLDKKYLVYELLPGGDLQGRLKKCREGKAEFTWRDRTQVALGAASGLAHMMSSRPKAFHRDIKPANILLDADGSAKMADFGLAGVLHDADAEHIYVKSISGTPGYVCPSYALTGRVSEQSEVYAFGMVLLELLVPHPPALIGPEGDLVFPLLQCVQPAAPGAHRRVQAQLDQSAGWPLAPQPPPPPPPHGHPAAQPPAQHTALSAVVEDIMDLALSCVDLVPERRPSFEMIVKSLKQARRGQSQEQAGGRHYAVPPGGARGGGG